MRTVFFVFVGADEASSTVQPLFHVFLRGEARKHGRAYTRVMLALVLSLVSSDAAISRGEACRGCGGGGVVLDYE